MWDPIEEEDPLVSFVPSLFDYSILTWRGTVVEEMLDRRFLERCNCRRWRIRSVRPPRSRLTISQD
jgi:hypothetical protein